MNRTYFGSDGERGQLRLKPGPHPTKHKRRFLARYWATLTGFHDRLRGVNRAQRRPTAAETEAYHRGWNRAARYVRYKTLDATEPRDHAATRTG